jgi:hypothetical protein
MDLSHVVFVGGDPKLGSVQIRCVQIAQALGCRFVVGATSPRDIPYGARAIVLVKSPIDTAAFPATTVVIRDIIDAAPRAADIYLASTQHALHKHRLHGVVIPHHHANDASFVDDGDVAAWIGGIDWYPDRMLRGVRHVRAFTDGMSLVALRAAYRRAGILLNLRCVRHELPVHTEFTSGIKLINAIGFGLPSISPREPAYEELAPECTIFVGQNWPDELYRLRRDADLRAKLRRACEARASEFNLHSIAARYRAMLMRL